MEALGRRRGEHRSCAGGRGCIDVHESRLHQRPRIRLASSSKGQCGRLGRSEIRFRRTHLDPVRPHLLLPISLVAGQLSDGRRIERKQWGSCLWSRAAVLHRRRESGSIVVTKGAMRRLGRAESRLRRRASSARSCVPASGGVSILCASSVYITRSNVYRKR